MEVAVSAEAPRGREAPATKSPNQSRAAGSRAPRRHRVLRPATTSGARRQSASAVTSPRCLQGTAAVRGRPRLASLNTGHGTPGSRAHAAWPRGPPAPSVRGDNGEPTGTCRPWWEAAAPAPARPPRGRPDTEGRAWATNPTGGPGVTSTHSARMGRAGRDRACPGQVAPPAGQPRRAAHRRRSGPASLWFSSCPPCPTDVPSGPTRRWPGPTSSG